MFNVFFASILSYSVVCVILFLVGAVIGAAVNWYVDRYSWVKRFRSPWRRSDKLKRVYFDFIPILGWLNLRRLGESLPESGQVVGIDGKWFWVRPFLVELFLAVGLVLLYWWEVVLGGLLTEPEFAELSETTILRFAAHAFLFTLLLAASLTDLDDFVIPENLTIAGTIAGLIFVTIFPQILLPATELYLDKNGRERLTNYPVPLHFCSPDKVDVLRNYTETNSIFSTQSQQDETVTQKSNLSNSNSDNKESRFMLGIQFSVITFFWLFWCFAMMDRVWYWQLSFRRALLLFFRNLSRSPSTKYWLLLAVVVPVLIFYFMFFSRVLGLINWYYLLTGFIGLAVGMWLIWSVRLVAGFALGVEAMGFGDVVLLGMIGVWVGWQSCVVIFFIAPFAGIIPSLIAMFSGRGRRVPYGPFLSIAALLLIIFWSPIWCGVEPILFLSSVQVAVAVQILILLMGAILICWRKIRERL
ncbi:MAG: A24 family peptidase [Planctomycetaceae bacterium]|jgi:prepilin signal peptidase PulO-like enzyme (type II secretory pathway)|nr:A24 family peptidase [Planctomycetaceae bacterium]